MPAVEPLVKLNVSSPDRHLACALKIASPDNGTLSPVGE